MPAGVLRSLPGDLVDTDRWREITISQEVSGYPGLRVFENLRTLPRAWLVPAVESMPDNQQLESIRGEGGKTFDPYAVALIDPASASRFDQALRVPSDQASPDDGKRVRITRRTPQAMTLATTAPRPTVLVMSELDYPGWKATINGHEVENFTGQLPPAGACPCCRGAHCRGVLSAVIAAVRKLISLVAVLSP